MEKKNNRFSPLEKHKIMDLKSKGYGYKAIATRLGISCDAVKSFIRRHKDDPQYSTYLMGRCKECGKELLWHLSSWRESVLFKLRFILWA